MNIPEIRINDGWMLRENASNHLHELWAKEGQKLEDDAWMKQRVADYQAAWKPVEDKILHAMCASLGLEFFQNVLDVYIAPWFNAFSEPLVIGVMREPDEFIDTLAHELLHRLLTDNTTSPKDALLANRWEKLFGETDSFNETVHIPVHAVLKHIYLDILKQPERLERDIEHTKNDPPYKAAWDYVNGHDYMHIIELLKQDYIAISQEGKGQ
jgi:hypothetical protein